MVMSPGLIEVEILLHRLDFCRLRRAPSSSFIGPGFLALQLEGIFETDYKLIVSYAPGSGLISTNNNFGVGKKTSKFHQKLLLTCFFLW